MQHSVFLFILLAFFFASQAFSQNEQADSMPAGADTLIVDLNFDENLDSLLNLYYVEQSLAGGKNCMGEIPDSLIVSFPDTVYRDRLRSIPTAVELTFNSMVRRYIDVYTQQKRSSVGVMLGLSQYYFPLFDDIFDYYDVPNELKYMSIIESALNPRAYSRTRAVGLWQFMYGTGRLYGLQVNSLVDERRDPVKSTHAAARFVKDLYSIYHDWLLVVAAYNCGPGNVNKAIRRSGGKRSFWEIYPYLPHETRGHVPAFIAATYVMNFYKEHNLRPVEISFPATSDSVMITRNLHLIQVSEVIGIPLQLLRDMNPQYRSDIIPGQLYPMPLRLPLEQVAKFMDFEKDIYAYKNETFPDPNKTNITVTTNRPEDPPPGNYAKLSYTVKEGDNLGFISMWYNVSLSDIRYWNNIRHNTIRSGQRLTIYVPRKNLSRYQDINRLSFKEKQARIGKNVTPAAENTGKIVDLSDDYVLYTVKQGDTIWDIMKKYPGVTEMEIKKWNNLTDAGKIRAGQQLKIKPKS
jgi:membrane-bound lytic murein transglycosylase D